MSEDIGLNKQYKIMTETPIPKLVIKLGIPTTISMLISNIYNMADTYFVSQLGTSASGAVGIIFGLMSIIQAFGFLFGQGAGSIVSRKLGAGEKESASRYASIGFYFALFSGLLFTVLGLIFLKPLMYLLGSTDTIYPYAKDYGLYILLSSSVMMTSFVLNCVLRYEGKAIFAMVGLSIGAIINIFLDYILIFIFDMGIAGAGISTAISQFISFLILFIFAKSRAIQIDLSLKNISSPAFELIDILKTGFPSLVRQGLASVSSMILNHQAGMYGDAAVAGMAIVSRIQMFVFAVGLGLSQGFQPISAYNYGAKKYDRVKKSFYFTVFVSMILLCTFSLFGILNADALVSFFRDDPDVLNVGVYALKVQLMVLFVHPIILCTNMMLQSVGWSKQAAMLSALRSGVFFVPLVLILPTFLGLRGIQIAQPISDIFSLICTFPFLISFIKDVNEKEKLNIN